MTEHAPAGDPDGTAVRVALWRALHVEVDDPPHVIDDTVGLRLVAPRDDWRARPDMHPVGTRGFRAAIVARARFIEDLVVERATAQTGHGTEPAVVQYVLLGAGLDTFAQRRPDLAPPLRVFEIDQPGTQSWKRRRLQELGYAEPDWLRFVPVDFEAGASWWRHLVGAGFNPAEPAVVASTGVSMYLSRAATVETLHQLAALAPGSTLVMSFLLPPELLDAGDRRGLEESAKGAGRSGTPFVSFYSPADVLDLARTNGFDTVRHVPGRELAERYFAGRSDGLRPSSGEDLLVADT